ncbi:MAG: multidrug efflux RND transporter permease subunit [Deltaproteobacteria bacterium]|nr:multidrug efflux RND transporter permease subunit [Deltaproteobacteria bacterium]
MLSRFFINRPIFASVISILIVIAGGICILTLPVAQYPDITPPVVQVRAFFPGADPKVIADTVASPIEQEVNGVQNMLYMSSTSAVDGSYTLSVTFELGTDIDMATVLTQNRVATAIPKLPQEVQRQGVTTKKVSSALVAVMCLYSPDGRFDDLYLTNYVSLRIKDELSRIRGVGNVEVFPQKDYGMRLWLDPRKMESRSLTTNEVVDALRQQNVQVAAGMIGQRPSPKGQDFQLNVNTLGRLTDESEFENIVVKTADGGKVTRVKDIARVDLGGKAYDTFSIFNGKPTATIVIYQSPGSNALQVADDVQKSMETLKREFPQGLDYKAIYEISNFVRSSIHEVIKTLFEAFILVFIVVFVFLQDWRATIIPAITIPVSLIGTFAVMAMLGFSINMVTLFGMVLAIGIVVDDAIVVVENVERNMTEYGLGAKEASIRAMEEVTGPIIGITLVLMAVFVPAAFMGGITGELYRQFSLTIAITTLFSAVNALTLSPALCAILLRSGHGTKNVFFRVFNSVFDRITYSYSSVVTACLRRVGSMMIIFIGLVAFTCLGFLHVPTGFVPSEDDGLILVNIQMPDGASLDRTEATVQKVGVILDKTNGISSYGVLGGYSLIDGAAPNQAGIFAPLTSWDERIKNGRNRDVIMAELTSEFRKIQEGTVFVFTLPPIFGLGTGGGFELQLQDKSDLGLIALQRYGNELASAANGQPRLKNVFSTYRATVPNVFVKVDREKAHNMGVPLQTVFDAMSAYLGSTYVNDFNKFGRTWQVKVQADSLFRSKPEDILKLQVRNKDGKMLPLGAMATVEDSVGPLKVDRYNLYPTAKVMGGPAPGYSSGQALQTMEKLAQIKLPVGMGYSWTAMAFQEKKAGSQAVVIFSLAILVVLLILAAQYESWADPFSVVLVVPMAVLGAVAALMIRHMDNNIYTQVGLVLLVGLSAKNAILIVEFAREMRIKGKGVIEATVEGSKLRFRPILMTSFAFILGVVPLVVASGAGAVSRQALGTAVFAGMLGVTILGVFFTPVLYVFMQRIRERFSMDSDRQGLAKSHPTE